VGTRLALPDPAFPFIQTFVACWMMRLRGKRFLPAATWRTNTRHAKRRTRQKEHSSSADPRGVSARLTHPRLSSAKSSGV